MDIQATITDQQAANLAAAFGITDYADGSDLISQIVTAQDLDTSRKLLVKTIVLTKDQAVLDAMMAAVATTTGTPISMPPIKIKPPVG